MKLKSLIILYGKLYNLSYDVISSCFDFFLFIFKVRVHIPNDSKIPGIKKIVFAGGALMPRIPRIAIWLKRNGFYTILVTYKKSFFEEFSNSEWDFILLFRNKYHLKRIIKQLKEVYIYHAFAPKSFYPDIIRQTVNTPFIIDMQDVYSCYYGLNPDTRWIKSELIFEKKCLQLASGVVGASLEPNVALRKYGRPKPLTIYFPLYCDNDFFRDNTKQLSENDIHLVYAGGIAGSHRNKNHYGAIQFRNLINVLSEQKIHFHIYPSPSAHSTDKSEYVQIDNNNIYFHFHKPVSQENLADELSKYHFGVLPFFSKDTGMSSEKSKYATSLKLFNYIEAGIPVLVSRDLEYQSWIVNRYCAGIVITPDDLSMIKEIVTAIDYRVMVENLMKNREEISLKKHIPRLIEFYKKIADK
jgi:hypothetical protein